MAHFRGVIKGQRGEASRLGSSSSGMMVRLQTWGWDVVVESYVDGMHVENGRDVGYINLVHHSTGETKHVATVDLTTGTII